MYLDVAAPAEAHRLLEPYVERHLEFHASTIRLRLLAALVESCIALGHADHLRRWLPELERSAREAEDVEAGVRVCAAAVLAQGYCEQGKYERALAVAALIDEGLLRRCSVRIVFAYWLARIAALRRLSRYEEAEGTAAHLLARTQEESDLLLQGHACGQLANILKLRGRLEEAQKLYARAAHLHRQAGDYRGVVIDHLNRGWVLNRLGFQEESAEAFAQAHRRALEIGHEALSLKARIGLGMAALRRGRWEEARRCLLAAWREARRKGMPREEALALEFLAETAVLARRMPQARTALRLARSLAKRLAPRGDLAVETGIRSALVALASAELEKARREALETASLAEETGLVWERAQALRLAATASARAGQKEEARQLFVQAHSLFEGMGERFEIHLVRWWLDSLSGYGGSRRPRAVVENGWLGHVVWAPTESGSSRRNPGTRYSATPRARAPLHPIWKRLGLVTRTPSLLRTMEAAQDLARSQTHLLITGETGTGKELLARGIHTLSGRRGRFVPFNCAACPPELVESELFGAERGAFTGAERRRDGLILEAAGGTLFLDEVADLAPRAQGTLLRFLDTGEVRRLGSTRYEQVSVGVLAATNQPLEEHVREGRFREDLYFRLCAARLRLPPLKERMEDLDLLLPVLWNRFADGRSIPRWLLGERVLKILRAYAWPGNVRQLAHFVRRLVAMQEGDPEQTVVSLIREYARLLPSKEPALEEVLQALVEADGNRTRAAALLGITRQRLYRLLKAYDLS
jgi:transcriptional regulator with AAA-type ATPase domain/tetratricopeptide (TPR) repeat protein